MQSPHSPHFFFKLSSLCGAFELDAAGNLADTHFTPAPKRLAAMNSSAKTQAQPVRFVTSPRTIIARSAVTGQMVKLGSFDNYFLAEPVMRAAIAAEIELRAKLTAPSFKLTPSQRKALVSTMGLAMIRTSGIAISSEFVASELARAGVVGFPSETQLAALRAGAAKIYHAEMDAFRAGVAELCA